MDTSPRVFKLQAFLVAPKPVDGALHTPRTATGRLIRTAGQFPVVLSHSAFHRLGCRPHVGSTPLVLKKIHARRHVWEWFAWSTLTNGLF